MDLRFVTQNGGGDFGSEIKTLLRTMQPSDRHSTTLSCVYTKVPDLRWSRDFLVEAYLITMWFGGFRLTTPPFQL